MIKSYYVIYHPEINKKKDTLDRPLNYFAQMTGIGPAFGATAKDTPRFETSLEAVKFARGWPMMVLWELEHVAEVTGEDKTWPTCGLVQHYANLAIEVSFNRAAREEVEREAQEEADRDGAEVREPEPGEGVQLDARSEGAKEVEAPGEPVGAAPGEDESEGGRVAEEANPAEEGRDAGVDGLAFWKDHLVAVHIGEPKYIGPMTPRVDIPVSPRIPGPATEEGVEVEAAAQPQDEEEPEEEELVAGAGPAVALRDADLEGHLQILDGGDGVVKVGLGSLEGPVRPGVVMMSKETFDHIVEEDGAPEHTQDPDSDWPRVGGDVVCDQCGKTYYQHPLDGPEGMDGKFLNRICDGRLVKL